MWSEPRPRRTSGDPGPKLCDRLGMWRKKWCCDPRTGWRAGDLHLDTSDCLTQWGEMVESFNGLQEWRLHCSQWVVSIVVHMCFVSSFDICFDFHVCSVMYSVDVWRLVSYEGHLYILRKLWGFVSTSEDGLYNSFDTRLSCEIFHIRMCCYYNVPKCLRREFVGRRIRTYLWSLEIEVSSVKWYTQENWSTLKRSRSWLRPRYLSSINLKNLYFWLWTRQSFVQNKHQTVFSKGFSRYSLEWSVVCRILGTEHCHDE